MDRDSVEQLVALEDVQRVVLSSCLPLAPIEIGLSDALGFVLAEDVHASDDLPPFANTAMDGYAVRATDTMAAPVELLFAPVLDEKSRWHFCVHLQNKGFMIFLVSIILEFIVWLCRNSL